MAKSFELRIRIVEVRSTEIIGEKGFKKREVIGMIEGEYPEYYKFEFVNDNVGVPDDLIESTYATIKFNLKGRKIAGATSKDEDRYFTSLQAWSVDVG
jgi:single-strand DNA-binding protein